MLKSITVTNLRQLDALVEEHVFGHTVRIEGEYYVVLKDNGGYFVPNYSGEIGAAWLIAKKLGIALIHESDGATESRWLACKIASMSYDGDIHVVPKDGNVNAERSAPVAICLAALASVEIELDLCLGDDTP